MTRRLKKVRKRIKNWVIFVAVKSGVCWMLTVQRITAMKFLQSLAVLGFYLVKSERNKTLKNLTKIYGETKTEREIFLMGKEVFANLGKYMADAFMMSRFTPENIDDYVEVNGIEKLDSALAQGNGVIALTGHIGNWEMMGAYLALKGYPVNVVGAPVYDPRLDALVVKNREHSGMKYIARGDATRQIIRVLRQNEIIGLLTDQDTKKVDGVFVDFLGYPAYTPIGPVVLAMKTKAAIIVMAVNMKKNGSHVITVKDQIQLRFTNDTATDRIYNTKLCNDVLSEFILRNPTQWVWMHERWKTKPEDIN